MNAIEEQKRAELKDDKLNYSVVAGAGAGKTTMLSHRISNQIKDGESIESFAIITYTNVAATELREKIVDVLCGMKETLSGVEKENIQYALENIDLLQVSTIHSFLFKILREHCFEAGLSMDARKLEPGEEKTRKKTFFIDWKNKYYDTIKLFRSDWIIPDSSGEPKDRTLEVMENMFMDIASVREEIALNDINRDDVFSKQAQNIYTNWYRGLIQFGQEVKKNVPKNKSNNESWYNPAKQVNIDIDELIAFVATITDWSSQDYIDVAVKMMNIYNRIQEGKDNFYGHSVGNRPWSNHVNQTAIIQTKIPQGYSDDDAEFPSKYTEYANTKKAIKLVKYVMEMQKAFQEMTDKDVTCISDDDILYRAKKLLLECPDILDKLRERYQKIYLDEAQDTTNIQLDIIKLLASVPGTDLNHLQLKSNNLVVVGDPKQSIYRFSGAEKELYDGMNTLLDDMPDDSAKKIMLEANFRSNNLIVDWVNDRYSKMIKDCKDAPMTTDWQVKDTDTLCGVYHCPENVKYDMQKDIESVVGLVQYLTNCPNFMIEEYNRQHKSYSVRPIKYSDFLIITRTTTKIAEYMKEFRKKGIPVNVEGKFNIEDEQVLKDFVTLIRYIVNAKLSNNLVNSSQILGGYDATTTDQEALEETKEQLRCMCAQFRKHNMNTASIVNYLLNHSELYLQKDREYSVNEVDNYKTKLHQMVETCLMGSTGDLTSLVIRMEQYIETRLSREVTLQPGEDAVRLMNLHKSKGLTGKIVIIADRRTGTNPKFAGFKSNGKYYPSVRYSDEYDNGTKIPTYKTITTPVDMYQKAMQDENAEFERLEYVAATRAAHALIFMPMIHNKERHSEGIWFEFKLGGSTYTNVDGEDIKGPETRNLKEWIDERIQNGLKSSVTSNVNNLCDNITTLEDFEKNLEAVKSNIEKRTKSTIVSIAPSGFEAKGTTGYSPADEGYKREDRPKGNIFGNVTHRTFEFVVKAYDRLRIEAAADREQSIRGMIKRAIMENKADFGSKDDEKAYMDYLYPIVLKYWDSIIMNVMEDAEEVYPEYSFGFYVPKNDFTKFCGDFKDCTERANILIETEKVWINGQIDLVVKTKSGKIKIYDYKSDGMYGKSLEDFEESLLKKYDGQLRLYTYAASKIFEVSEKEIETQLIHFYL